MNKTIAALVAVAVVACAGKPGGGVLLDGRVVTDSEELAAVLDSEVACLPGGAAVMGTDAAESNDSPAHVVTLDPFCLSRYEVTNGQYERFVETTGARVPPHWEVADDFDDLVVLPVVGVDWEEAAGYCDWIGGRLPTEAEWERACRGDSGRSYPWGATWEPGMPNIATTDLSEREELWSGAAGTTLAGGAAVRPVGSHPGGTTPEGIHDLCGNAAEWVADWHDPDAYETLTSLNPVSKGPPWSHVIRGGSWLIPVGLPDLAPRVASCTARDASHADQSARIGFRCAFDPAP